ncbi:hypothetical protein DRN67_03480, partial [Candidatus Micrarchaeota archaeon]
MTEMSYELLRKIQAQEREGAALSRLPPDFYESVRKMIGERKEKLNGHFSLSEAKEFENVLKVLRDVFALREQKMVLRALATAGGSPDGSRLTDEEKGAFDKLVEVLEERKAFIEELMEGKESKAGRQKTMRKMRVLVPIPQFVGADGKRYGPYERDEEVRLPRE